MIKINFKNGLIISMIISSLATIPRIIGLESSDIWHLSYHFIYLVILNFIFWFLAQFFIKINSRVILNLILFLFLSGIISYLFNLLASSLFFKFQLIYNEYPIIEGFKERNYFAVFFLRGMLFGGTVYFIDFYLKLIFEKQKSNLEIEQLKKEKLEAQLSSLKQQISPHFLFNSLSTLRTIVEDDNSKMYINKLSNVYRYLLNLNENDLVSVKSELDFTESYLYILKERFEEALQIEINIAEDVLEKQLPPLVLQLLIENAIKHNVVSIKNPLSIKIINELDYLVISNNIQEKYSTEISTGKGLNNIKNRYNLLLNQNIKIDSNATHFIVKIPLL